MPTSINRRDLIKSASLASLAAVSIPGACAQAQVAQAEPVAEVPRIRTGPYLQNPASDAVTVMWMTSTSAHGFVEFGETEQLGKVAQADVDGLVQANTALHKVRLTGLKPGTKHFYRVRSRPLTGFRPYKIEFGPTIDSPVYSFTTPAPTADKVRFIVFNDIHDNVELWKTLHAIVAKEPLDFVFLNGDIVDYLTDEKQMVEHFLDPCTAMFAASTPFLYARGNHETRGAYARRMMDYLDLPGGRYYYAQTWGPMRLVVLDSGEDKPDTAPVYAGLCNFDAYRETQQKWLADEVAGDAFKSAKFRVVIHHIPAYYNGRADDNPAPETHGFKHLRAKWWPILNEGKVDLYIGGHTHRPTIKPADPPRHVCPYIIGGGPKKGNGTVMLAEISAAGVKVKMWRDTGEVIGEVGA